MTIYPKKRDTSTHRPGALHFIGTEADLRAIQLSYFLVIIKTLTAQLLNQK